MIKPPARSAATSAGPVSASAGASAASARPKASNASAAIARKRPKDGTGGRRIIASWRVTGRRSFAPDSLFRGIGPQAGAGVGGGRIVVESDVALRLRAEGRAHRREVVELAVEQVRGDDVAERVEDRLDAARMLLLPFAQQRAHLLALQVFLRAAERAGDDRKGHRFGVAREIALAQEGERPDDLVAAGVGDELRRQRLELGAEEQVEEVGREQIVAVVAERYHGRADLARDAVEHTPAQPRAQRAQRLAVGN